MEATGFITVDTDGTYFFELPHADGGILRIGTQYAIYAARLTGYFMGVCCDASRFSTTTLSGGSLGMEVSGMDRRCALPTLHGIDRRLGRRYSDLFLTHLSSAQKLAAGFHAHPAGGPGVRRHAGGEGPYPIASSNPLDAVRMRTGQIMRPGALQSRSTM